MADNVQITAGAGTVISTDQLTINAVATQVQRGKLCASKLDTYIGDVSGRLVDGDANAAALFVDPRLKTISITNTPTITSGSAYAANQNMGGLQDLSNAVRASGGSGQVKKIVVVCTTGTQKPALDLVFFNANVSPGGDKTNFAPSDADMQKCIGVVTIGGYAAAWASTSTDTVSTLLNVGFDFVVTGTDLFVQAVVRSTPTMGTTTDLHFTYTIVQD